MKERKIVRKWCWVWDFGKEELWLNEMAMNGWLLCKVSFCKYTFEKCEPGEYAVRLEMHGADDAYIDFMRETGAIYIGRRVKWIYFCKKTEDGPFDIFSDIDSKTRHLDKIGKMLGLVCIGNILVGLSANTAATTNMGFLNLLCAALLAYALGRIHGKKEALEKERLIHE